MPQLFRQPLAAQARQHVGATGSVGDDHFTERDGLEELAPAGVILLAQAPAATGRFRKSDDVDVIKPVGGGRLCMTDDAEAL